MKTSAVVGMATLLSEDVVSALEATETVDLAVIRGNNYFQNTIRAVEQLGGIQQFVPRMSNVGLLINSRFPNVGAHVNPDIVLAVVKMCYEAGAKEIHFMVICPPIRYSCFYGIDIPDRSKLIAFNQNISGIAKLLDVDTLFYPNENDIINILQTDKLCLACLNGVYPIMHKDQQHFIKRRKEERCKENFPGLQLT